MSLIGFGGNFGELVRNVLNLTMGRGAFLVLILFILLSIVFIRIQRNQALGAVTNLRITWGIVIMSLAFLGFLSHFNGIDNPNNVELGGGFIGYFIYPIVFGYFGWAGGLVCLTSVMLFGFFVFTQRTFTEVLDITQDMLKDPSRFWDLIPDVFEVWRNWQGEESVRRIEFMQDVHQKQAELTEKVREEIQKEEIKEEVKEQIKKVEEVKQSLDKELAIIESESAVKEPVKENTEENEIQKEVTKKLNKKWILPSTELLEINENREQVREDVEGNKRKIAETFASFNINVQMGPAITGPTVSQYTFRPQSGVKLSRINALQKDIALALAASSLRMELPIPGQSAASIEIPNKFKNQVKIRDIIDSERFIAFDAPLPIAVGKNVSGTDVIYSLAKAPHLLVAGATGAGKSVWINSLLISLLYRYSPKNLQLILVDMKMVELNLYEGIPHLLSDVITESEKAINALKWLIVEMDRRYQILKQYGKRNIRDYNHFALTAELETLPYTICVIDELADLMMQAKSEVEPIIARLTAMSRAVGIHLVLGTQRPDVNVVTGLIKTNIPTRICFAVVSQIDSRVILDSVGGETLLGMGDGLIKSPNSIQPIRFQGAYVDEGEIKEVVDFLSEQKYQNPEMDNRNPDITEPPVGSLNVPGIKERKLDKTDTTLLYEEAKKLVIELQHCSINIIAGNLDIDRKIARKIIDELENNQIVGPQIIGIH